MLISMTFTSLQAQRTSNRSTSFASAELQDQTFFLLRLIGVKGSAKRRIPFVKHSKEVGGLGRLRTSFRVKHDAVRVFFRDCIVYSRSCPTPRSRRVCKASI